MSADCGPGQWGALFCELKPIAPPLLPAHERAENLVTRMALKCEALSKVFLVLFVHKENSSILPKARLGKLQRKQEEESERKKHSSVRVTKTDSYP